MSSKLSYKFLLTGFLIASIIAIGTIYVYAQSAPASSVNFDDYEEVTITGTVSSIDDHGFTMTSGENTYYVPLPYTVDRSVLNLAVGSEVTVTGYVMDSSMNHFSSYPMIHSTSINGIAIEHNPQMQSRSGNCGGNGGMGGMGGNGPYRGGMRG